MVSGAVAGAVVVLGGVVSGVVTVGGVVVGGATVVVAGGVVSPHSLWPQLSIPQNSTPGGQPGPVSCIPHSL